MAESPLVYTVKEVADLLKCGLSTVYTMIQAGRLHAIRLRGDRGGIRVLAETVEELLRPPPAPPTVLPPPPPDPRRPLAVPGLHLPVPPGMKGAPPGWEPAPSRPRRKRKEQ